MTTLGGDGAVIGDDDEDVNATAVARPTMDPPIIITS